jgi:hypothetical protein
LQVGGIDFGGWVCEYKCMDNNNEGYKPNFAVHPDTGEKTLVADPNKARDLADLEGGVRNSPDNTTVGGILSNEYNNKLSQLSKEDELAGMTPVEKANMDISNGLTMKEGQAVNTHAFVDKEDAKGRKYRALHTGGVEVQFPKQVVFFCKEGAFALNWPNSSGARDAELEDIDWDKLGDGLESAVKDNPEFYKGKLNLPLKNGETVDTSIAKFNLDPTKGLEDLTLLAAGIKKSEVIGVNLLAAAAEKAKILDPGAALKGLVG